MSIVKSATNGQREGTDLVPFDLTQLGDDVGALAVSELVRASIASSTKAVYARAIRAYDAWCDGRGHSSVPTDPGTLARFLAHEVERGKAPKSLGVVLAAIRAAHLAKGHSSPTDHELIRRVMGGAARRAALHHQDRRKQPIKAHDELDQLISIVESELEVVAESVPSELSHSASHHDKIERAVRAFEKKRLAALRDRAIILMGFAGALRRSEVVAIRVGHIRRVGEGIILTVPRSKTDQEGRGRQVAIPFGTRLCPIAALEAWRAAARIYNGPIFRRITKGAVIGEEALSDGAVARIVKKRAIAAGLDPAPFSGHSLRAGFLTSAGRAGASIWKMMDQAGQKTVDVTRGYVRDVELFDNHAGKGLL